MKKLGNLFQILSRNIQKFREEYPKIWNENDNDIYLLGEWSFFLTMNNGSISRAIAVSKDYIFHAEEDKAREFITGDEVTFEQIQTLDYCEPKHLSDSEFVSLINALNTFFK